jgi:hypothetical protein
MRDDAPTCPDCGSEWARSGPYFNILGELSDMKVTEATDKYYRDPDRYRSDTVHVFKCGNKIIDDELVDDPRDPDAEQ